MFVNKKILVIILILVIFPYKIYAGIVNHKPYYCNYHEGIFNNPNLAETGDVCTEGGTSQYKFYLDKKFTSFEKCMSYIEEHGNTADSKRRYPTDKWMIGCDKNW